jgi:Protein of unknown function (DUF2783)
MPVYSGEFKLSDGDGFYQALIESHADLSLEDSHRLNARLVLMLANELGNTELLKEILKSARNHLVEASAYGSV